MAVQSAPAFYKDKKTGRVLSLFGNSSPLKLMVLPRDAANSRCQQESCGRRYPRGDKSQHVGRLLGSNSSENLEGPYSAKTNPSVQAQTKRNKKNQVSQENPKPPRLVKWWALWWFVGLLIICSMSPAPHQAAAWPVNGHNTYEPGCSVAGSSEEDGVLDSLDVKAGLDDRRSFTGSGRGYSRICSDAFHDVYVEDIFLQNNFLNDLSDGLFNHTIDLETVYLGGNNFTQFPSALNSSTDITFLDLSYNQITHIDRGTMNGMIGLNAIDFSGNEKMVKVPEDTFRLMRHSLKRVILTETLVQHPLIPVPRNAIFMNPLHVTHKGILVSISNMVTKVTFEITQNGSMTCEELKEKLNNEFKILNGELNCRNNSLDGTIEIVREGKSFSDTTDVPTTFVTDQQTDKAINNVTITNTDQHISSVSARRRFVVGFIAAFVFGLIVGMLGMRLYSRKTADTSVTFTGSSNLGVP